MGPWLCGPERASRLVVRFAYRAECRLESDSGQRMTGHRSYG